MIRVGIVGIGTIAPKHLEGYATFPGRCEIVALADIIPERARIAAACIGERVNAYSSHQEMLEAENIDLISIATPPGSHAEIAIDSLAAGCHVLVEKPMASGLDECDAMISAASKANRLLSVVTPLRFTTDMMRMKEMLSRKVIGRILHAQVDSFFWRGDNYYEMDWRGTWESEGGGCTLNHAVHHIDLLLWLMGRPRELMATMSNIAHGSSEVEDLAMALLRFPEGALGVLTASLVHHGQQQQLVFQGERASLGVPYRCFASEADPGGFPIQDESTESRLAALFDSLPTQAHEMHTGQIDNVLAAIDGLGELVVDGVQGRDTIEFISALYKSAIARQPIELPLDRADEFYTRSGLVAAAPRYKNGALNA